jgi:hypothetical protein
MKSTLCPFTTSPEAPGTGDISISIVAFQTNPLEISTLLGGFVESNLRLQVTLVDNFPIHALSEVTACLGAKYCHNQRKEGLRAGHNRVFEEQVRSAPYHLMVTSGVVLSL